MKSEWDYGRCAAVLEAEISVLGQIRGMQNSVRRAVLAREWADFDWKMAELGQLGQELEGLEAQRETLFWGMAGGEKSSFYALAARLPPDEGRRLSDLYRRLKLESLAMRAMNESFLLYLTEARSAAAAYLDAALPSRGGGLYTRHGSAAGRDLKSMVLNRRI